MNTESLTCRKVGNGEIQKPGDFCFDDEYSHLYIWLPGCCGPDALRIQRGSPGGDRVWGWNGEIELPTLSPSIHAPGQWHGYLKSGNLESC
ncbi:MAG: DUF6527 family protein [Prosthecobacter sp.]|nr:DUF6527 family protein [Prosthecobacter sp.]